MKITTFLAAAVATSLVAAPALAAPSNPAAALSLSQSARSGSTAGHRNKLAPGAGILIGLLGAAAVGGGIAAAVTHNNETPVSR